MADGDSFVDCTKAGDSVVVDKGVDRMKEA
jgi:hypothetical protein